ncbi:hypothetical protein LMIY3S_03313 [Labrys miyagiensis]
MGLAKPVLLSVCLAAIASPVLAGPATDLARTRIQAIADGDVAAIMSGYADGAILRWIGGPLDGDYSAGASKDIWTRYAAAQGAQKAGITEISEAGNPKGATVTADVAFAGKSTVRVRYILVYRGGKVSDEIWQVNPGPK